MQTCRLFGYSNLGCHSDRLNNLHIFCTPTLNLKIEMNEHAEHVSNKYTIFNVIFLLLPSIHMLLIVYRDIVLEFEQKLISLPRNICDEM